MTKTQYRFPRERWSWFSINDRAAIRRTQTLLSWYSWKSMDWIPFDFLNLRHWNLFIICYLWFGIYLSSRLITTSL